MIFDIFFFIYGLFALISFFGILYKPKRGKIENNVEFVIPSVANYKTIKTLRFVIRKLKEKFPNIKRNVIVDDKKIEVDANLIVVPKEYNGIKCKGRALRYFVENYVKDDKWYVFLDDDSYPLTNDFLYEIKEYEGKAVAANGILYPRKGKSNICFIMDFLRYIDDLFAFRFFTGLLKKPRIGFHGELLIAKGKVLKEISFEDSLVEDFVFAMNIIKKKYKTWQSRTIVSILSPNNIKDFLKQRARWIKGIALSLKHSDIISKICVIARMFFGLGASLIFLPLWFIFPPTLPISYFGFFGMFYYLSAYLYGIFKTKSFHYILLIPLMALLEVLGIFITIKIKNFFVINKD